MSETPAAPAALQDPKRIQRIARRISVAVAVIGFGYLYLRFSIVRPDPRVTADPYDRSVCVLDHRWSWGRDLEQGDLIYYRFPGEEQERPVEVMALPGDSLQVAEDGTVTVGDRRWAGADGPKLGSIGTVPAGHLVLINHAVTAGEPDSRTHGAMPMEGVTGRIVMAWP
ncbi:MAG: S26 family signal peptidase, partial [Planctomycetota bacterium]